MPGQAWRNKLSYKETVIMGAGGSSSHQQIDKHERMLEVPNDVGAFKDLIGKVVVGNVVSLEVMVSLRSLLSKYRLGSLSIHYIGGLLVLINFYDHKAAGEFACNHEVWKEWFSQLDVWQGQSLPYERIAWLKVFGVPFNLTDVEVFRRVGQEFGKVLYAAGLGPGDEDLSMNRVGVLVGDGLLISDSINLVWQDKCFKVWVLEDSDDWIPDCIRAEEESDGDSSSKEEVVVTSPKDGEPPRAGQEVQTPLHVPMQIVREDNGNSSKEEGNIESGRVEKGTLVNSPVDSIFKSFGEVGPNGVFSFCVGGNKGSGPKKTKGAALFNKSKAQMGSN
ncbi:hypothetical protein HanIR_Chr13g0656681 [Helianthus annuus]|nr:hypothetical protein HanIR_Chr13g0656681 [Helianthus annuus]